MKDEGLRMKDEVAKSKEYRVRGKNREQ